MSLHDRLAHATRMLERHGRRSTSLASIQADLFAADVLDRLHLLAAREQMRTALFRTYHGAYITSVSPLVLAMCEAEGLDLDSLTERLRPFGRWEP